jgi:hypothetical protein
MVGDWSPPEAGKKHRRMRRQLVAAAKAEFARKRAAGELPPTRTYWTANEAGCLAMVSDRLPAYHHRDGLEPGAIVVTVETYDGYTGAGRKSKVMTPTGVLVDVLTGYLDPVSDDEEFEDDDE